MKKVIISAVLCIFILTNGFAQTKQESIKELFHLMQTDTLMDKMFSSMIPSMQKQMQSQMQMKDSTSQANFNKTMSAVMNTTKEITKKMLDEDLVTIYDKYFTQDEIIDYIKFYKTSTGQKMIKLMPDIQKDIMMLMMQKYLPEIQKIMKPQLVEKK